MLVTLDDTKTLHETGSVRTNKLTGPVVKEINAIDTFTFNIYPDNSCYSDDHQYSHQDSSFYYKAVLFLRGLSVRFLCLSFLRFWIR